MKSAIYCRVSTLEQATEGYSIGVQKEKLHHYAEAQGYDIVDIYSDEGFSGKNLMRPAMMRLLDDIEQNKIDIVLIYKLDRLSRHVKDVLELVEKFDKFNVTLYSLSENIDLSSPFGRAALKMSATFSELERETIVERMEMGKTARAKSGRYSCPGKCPFGYRLNKEKDIFEIDPAEADAVRDMFNKYIEGYTFRKLYDYCKEKYPDIKYFSNSMSCKPVIERPLYAGYFIHKGELIKAVNVPPIISYETYLLAQEQIKRNTTKREHDNTPYLLTGLIVCGKCGHAYCGKLYAQNRINSKQEQKHYEHTSYGCVARIKYNSRDYGEQACNNAIFPTDVLDKYVENALLNLNFTEFVDPVTSSGTIDTILSENVELKKQKEKLLDLYLSDALDKDTFISKSDGIDKRIQKNNEIIEAEKETVSHAPTVTIDYLKQRQKEFPTASRKDKRRLLQLLIKQIVVNDDKIIISWRVK